MTDGHLDQIRHSISCIALNGNLLFIQGIHLHDNAPKMETIECSIKNHGNSTAQLYPTELGQTADLTWISSSQDNTFYLLNSESKLFRTVVINNAKAEVKDVKIMCMKDNVTFQMINGSLCREGNRTIKKQPSLPNFFTGFTNLGRLYLFSASSVYHFKYNSTAGTDIKLSITANNNFFDCSGTRPPSNGSRNRNSTAHIFFHRGSESKWTLMHLN